MTSNNPTDLLRQHGVQVTVSRQAVYDALEIMTTKGLVRRIQPAGSPARFEDRVGDNHHHVVCRSCGWMADVDCAVGDTPCLAAEDDLGFEIDEAEVVYWGVCPECREKTTEQHPQSPTGSFDTKEQT